MVESPPASYPVLILHSFGGNKTCTCGIYQWSTTILLSFNLSLREEHGPPPSVWFYGIFTFLCPFMFFGWTSLFYSETQVFCYSKCQVSPSSFVLRGQEKIRYQTRIMCKHMDLSGLVDDPTSVFGLVADS